MQNKIKEIQEYFKDKIIAGDFQHKLGSNKNEIIILIDDKYKFNLFINWWIAFQCPTWEINDHFMDLEFTKPEEEQIGAIFEKILNQNFTEIQKEKDLKEFERIKKLYNLI